MCAYNTQNYIEIGHIDLLNQTICLQHPSKTTLTWPYILCITPINKIMTRGNVSQYSNSYLL